MIKLLKALNTKKQDLGKKFKFGVKFPRKGDVRGAMKLDKDNGNNLWFEAQKKEANFLQELDTFNILNRNFDLSEYHYAPLIYAW